MNYKSKFTGKQIDDGIDKANSAYQKPQNGIPPKDLSEGVQNSLDKIDALPDHIVTDANYVHTDNNYTTEEKTKLANAITEEQDPTVPQWAKQPTKPSYTPQEVDALPANTPLFDGDYNDLENKPDLSGFITISVNNLVNYYLKSETYTKQEVHALIAAIQQFHYEIYASTSAVASPAGNVLYLIGPTGTGSDKYEEYVYDATKQEPWVKIGDNCKSAYELAKENGFAGTVAEWLASLKGDKGDAGIQGIQGEQGEKGDKGDAFTFADFTDEEIAALQKPATDAAVAANSTLNMLSSTLSEEEFVMSASASILCGWWNVASPPQATAEQQYWWDGASMHVSVAVLGTKGVITGYTWNPLALSDTAVYIDSSTSAVYQYKNGVMVSFSNITAVIALQLHGINEVLTKINAEV